MPWPTVLRPALLPWALALALAASACGEDGDYLEIKGGGFVFNYRIAEARYGLVAEARRPLPEGSLVVATFEDPAGGAPFRIEKTPGTGQWKYVFDTPPLHGVRKGRPYAATLEIVAADRSRVIERHERTYASNVSQDVLPGAPLTIGPGYAKNPAAGAN